LQVDHHPNAPYKRRTTMERIVPVEAPYEEEVARTLEAMMPPGVEPLRLFRTLAHNPRVLGKIRAGNLLDRGSIERVDREIAILRTCALCRSEYEWGVHVAIFSARFGISPETANGTVLWSGEDERWSEKERAIVQLADALHREATVDDELYRVLEKHFAEDQIVELLVLMGFYHVISYVTNALAIDLEPSGARFPEMVAATQ
jgi:4-carboxymuconolactone decarboxylase